MTITFFEYGNNVMFNAHDIPHELTLWEKGIEAGDVVLYHDSRHGTRPRGRVVSVSPGREYLIVRLAGYERFVIMRKINHDEYIVAKSGIAAMLETSGKLYYEGAADLQNIYWECDPEKRMHVVFLWYHNEEHRLFMDDVTMKEAQGGGELVDFISGRYILSA